MVLKSHYVSSSKCKHSLLLVMCVLSLGTILDFTAYPKLTLNILCEDGLDFHTALGIAVHFSKHSKSF